MDRRRLLTIVLIVGLAFFVAEPYLYTYVVWPPLAKRQAWQGELVRAYEREYGPYGPGTYHWEVRCDDGKVRTADVTLLLYLQVRPGMRVEKLKGERYPRLDEPRGYRLLEQGPERDPSRRLRPPVPGRP